MKCPYCGSNEDKVVDSRATGDNSSIRRRRECLKCGRRFTTYEYVEKIPLMVVKKDGRREEFKREKVLSGLLKACQKRKVSLEELEKVTDQIKKKLQDVYVQEVSSKEIGEMVMRHLYKIDDVAYVRFASVYRQFKDVSEFMKELKAVLEKKGFKKW